MPDYYHLNLYLCFDKLENINIIHKGWNYIVLQFIGRNPIKV